MPTLWIDLYFGNASLKGETILIEGFKIENSARVEVHQRIPLFDIDRVVTSSRMTMTGQLMGEILRRQIPIVIMNHFSSEYLGEFLPAVPSSGAHRLLQYKKTSDEAWCLPIAQALIKAKIYNQKRLLQKLAASRAVSLQIGIFDSMTHQLGKSTTPAEILGAEGMASASFWRQWAGFLPDKYPFISRSRRPPLNVVNSCLSYLSALCYGEFVSSIQAAGLDAGLGILHVTENNRWALALDLMEPFRAPLIEAVTMDLFSHQMINDSCSEYRDGGVYLTHDGKKKVVLRYESRITKEFVSEQTGLRTTLRQCIDKSVLDFKRVLNTDEPFIGFQLN